MPRERQKHAKFLQVLEYMDGPQAVLLERNEDAKIVAVAIDKDGLRYPFFGAEISYDQWERYRRGFVDLRFLFMYPRRKEWYIFDFWGHDANSIPLTRVTKTPQIEEDYIPEHGFFSYDHSEPIREGSSRSYGLQTYKTDGIWDLPDFAQFYGKIADLYSFFLCVKKFSLDTTPLDIKRRIRESFAEQPLRGGSSYRSMYFGAHSVLAREEDRIRVGKLRYGSAGEVDVRGRFDIFTEIKISLDELRDHYDIIDQEYETLYEFLRNNKLLRAEKGRFDESSPMAVALLQRATAFAQTMRLSDAELIYEISGRNSLIFTKILLSYFRRLRRYFMFFEEGRVKEPETIDFSDPK
jgi:hypothetical protein